MSAGASCSLSGLAESEAESIEDDSVGNIGGTCVNYFSWFSRRWAWQEGGVELAYERVYCAVAWLVK